MKKSELKILITAGGTSEKIDSVRRITNSGTGKLGALIAEAFAAWGADVSEAGAATIAAPPVSRIVYICSEGAVRPCLGLHSGQSETPAAMRHCDETPAPMRHCDETPAPAGPYLEIVIADDVAAVEAEIRKACEHTRFDVIIHSMAISDYKVKAVSDSASLIKGVMAKPDTCSKIPSDKDDLVVMLEKTPKLIAELRGLAEDAVIVGFKLLSEVSEEELISAGHALLVNNKCDFVLANDIKTVLSGRHEGFLIDTDGNYERAVTKVAIADLIVTSVLSKLR
jgi:phosphopantothenate-cysteine ligase